MPKRSRLEKIERYQRKLRRLEEDVPRRRKRIIYSSPSEESDENSG